MPTSEDLRFFMTLVHAPSFAAAAHQIAVTPPAVTQRLRAIEARLGVRLFHRSPRGVSLTDEGVLLAEHAAALLAELDALSDELDIRLGHVRGHLRVAASKGFGRHYVAPVIADYSKAHPGVRVTLDLSDSPLRLKPESWDVIVHIGDLPDMGLSMQTLAPNRRMLCCAPAYAEARGLPAAPHDLTNHACLAVHENDEDVTLWRLRSKSNDTAAVRVTAPMMSNDGEVVRNWALAGHGIVLRSEWHVAKDIAAGRLIRVLPDWSPPDAPVVALLASRHGRTPRTRRFVEMLQAALTPAPWAS